MDILLYEEHPGIELRQNIGRLVNAIVAVLGPELSPGSSFFSRCKVCFHLLLNVCYVTIFLILFQNFIKFIFMVVIGFYL